MSLKIILSLALGLSTLAANNSRADQPSGNLIEVNSCEVYAGGCTVSSEAMQGGRQQLLVWDITGGSYQGADLKGLSAAVLKSSSKDNLAGENTSADRAVVYLPAAATPAQRAALLAWVKSRDARLAPLALQTRVVPMTFSAKGGEVAFSAGSFANLKAVSLLSCGNRSCGESLWYQPSVATSLFTVAENAGSQVTEPLLGLNWTDHGTRSIFLGRFSEQRANKNLFVQSADWCGPGGDLF